MKKTIGAKLIRVDLSQDVGSDILDQIKHKAADLINLCEILKLKDGRWASLAQTSIEQAVSWAEKAATVEVE